jgi:hypothetical protein
MIFFTGYSSEATDLAIGFEPSLQKVTKPISASKKSHK